MYESGTNYGSTILNFEKKPSVKIQNGKEAEIDVVVSNGRIIATDVKFGGKEYFSPPDLEVVGIGSGIGGRLRPVIENGKITDVKIINPGIGYTSAPEIIVKSAGIGQIFEPSVRSLSLNNLGDMMMKFYYKNQLLIYNMLLLDIILQFTELN